MTLDYAALAANTPQKVKAAVDLSAVVLAYGVELTPITNGRKLSGFCPFHDDTRPSFNVWRNENGDWSCGCWSCDFGPGDLFTFLQRWHECQFGEALQLAVELRDGELPDPPPINIEPEVRATMSLDRILARGTECQAVSELLAARDILVPADWLDDEWGVCADGGTVLIPHWGLDNRLLGIKRRAEYMGWRNVAARGSEFTELYGVFRYRGDRRTVILCEGESDTWSVSYWYRDNPDIIVVGLPCGVSATPRAEWLEFLQGHPVVLLFDADRAGREGAAHWRSALDGGSGVYTATLPDGTDATSAGDEIVYQAVENSV